MTKENVLKLLGKGLSDSNLINRLFDYQMHENAPFPEAEDILWNLESSNNTNFKITTSEYWISRDDIVASEFEGIVEETKEIV